MRRPQIAATNSDMRSGSAPARYLVSGWHAAMSIVRNQPKRVVRIWIETTHRRTGAHDTLVALAADQKVDVGYIDAVAWRQLDLGTSSQGVAVELRAFEYAVLDNILDSAEQNSVIILLDGVTDPQNLGGILRCAAFFGVTAVILPKDRSVHVTPTVERVASGGASVVPIALVTNVARTLSELKECGYWIYGTSLSDGVELSQADIVGRVVLVLGAEGKGLRRLTAEKCDQLVTIPGVGIQSLNVATFAGIILYDVTRKRVTA